MYLQTVGVRLGAAAATLTNRAVLGAVMGRTPRPGRPLAPGWRVQVVRRRSGWG